MGDFIGLIGFSGFFVFLFVSIILIILSIKNNQFIKYLLVSLVLSILCLVGLIANIDVMGKLMDQIFDNKQHIASIPASVNDSKKSEELPTISDTEKQLAFKHKIEQELEKHKIELENNNSSQIEMAKQEVKDLQNTGSARKTIQHESDTSNQQEPQKRAVPNNENDANRTAAARDHNSNSAPKDEDDVFILRRGQELKIDTVNISNNNRFKMVIFSNTVIGEQYGGIVTSLDGEGKPVVTKLDKPDYMAVEHSPNAVATVNPSYAGGLSFLSGEGGPFEVSIRAAPNAKLGEYRAYVTFQWAKESSIRSKYSLTRKEYKFKIVN